ncbi:MAG: 7-carboxy-7-deazaguanine synthase QueE [Gammaproteobacteria bacterium]|nr:MAG: 7-carboxy-7-deazaguanine synthase QueE [Gammaproteobacteria bacterium]
MSILINEIFPSIQGESNDAGYPTSFVRLSGCPLRCPWCDTKYAFAVGEKYSIAMICHKLAELSLQRICITGGEPLSQKNCPELIKTLADLNYKVSIETSGSVNIKNIDNRAVIVMDIKTPGSNHCCDNKIENLQYLKSGDQIKFVINDKKDYQWAKNFITTHQIIKKNITTLFSPVYNNLQPATMAQWLITDKLDVKLQLQLHKIINMR